MQPTEDALGGPKRTRRWATKTRTGCVTCRRRRIKCDEGAPFCKRCISTGRECEGYNHNAADVAKALAVYSQPVHNRAPPGVDPSDTERFAFDMLHAECVLQIPGFFDHAFWTVDVMRATQVYPAIWHAGLALAAMFRAVSITAQTEAARASREQNRTFALKEYNAAIAELLSLGEKSELSDAEKETILLASTLFTGLSALQEDHMQALEHARGGTRLFHQWEFWKHSSSSASSPSAIQDREDSPLATDDTDIYTARTVGTRKKDCVVTTKALGAVFTHFEMQFCNRLRTVTIPEWRWRRHAHACSDVPYASAIDAYTELQPLLAGVSHNERYHGVPALVRAKPMRSSQVGYFREFRAWKAKFDAFLASPHVTAADADAIVTLRIIWMVVEIVLQLDPDAGEMGWDAVEPEVARFVDFAEEHYGPASNLRRQQLKKQQQQQPGQGTGSRSFAFSFSVSECEMLAFTGTFCRNGALRRRIIRLLSEWPCRDGMVDARLLGLIVQAVMVFEENATVGVAERDPACRCVHGTFICRWHRVCLIDSEFLGMRKTKVMLTTVGMLKKNLPPHEVSFSW